MIPTRQKQKDRESNHVPCFMGLMFFSWGNCEPKFAGFEDFEEFTNYFVRHHESARRYNNHAAALIRTGHKVLTAYERLAIGSFEGYVTMMSRHIKEGL